MQSLDRTQPYTTTFGPDTAIIPFFQNGLYYNSKGELVDIPHNRDRFSALGLPWPGSQQQQAANAPQQLQPQDDSPLQPPGQPAPTGLSTANALPIPPENQPPSPDPFDPLAGKSAAAIFGISQKLRAQLDVSDDADAYVPTLDNVAGNREFIVRHLEGMPSE